ncbi:NAD(P)H-binding protein [Gordonia sp. TBRC 11910]|uniref:NAD(P)H-binding protein n=1 Tax=Gordonia asplenii TaxID=2725283 RepID=A0A848KTW7_9ACTN|nr:NAD(P)H-binding protein [Gordonia asplenii]NMO01940.1 NAD(P)H-binding protein [Gordonia asplenii]
MTKVAIIGGHGKIALKAARLLSARGDAVTSIIRNPDHSADIEATGAAPLVLDVENAGPAELADALRGFDAVVWSAGAGGGNPARTYAVDRDAAIASFAAATTAGVRRYVMVSYFGAGPDHGVPEDNSFYPYAQAKSAADAALEQTDLDWTILRPSRLSDEPDAGSIAVNTAAHPIDKGSVRRSTVAEVIAATLATPATVGAIVEFNDGPTPVADALASSRSN